MNTPTSHIGAAGQRGRRSSTAKSMCVSGLFFLHLRIKAIGVSLSAVPGTSCQATIVLSLRDTSQQALESC
jgi:hypothetical protein